MRAITPRGTWESRRLPGSGAGPSPDRALIGSEGILGVIAEAWVRVRPRPQFKTSCGVEFDDFLAAARAVREISQSGLNPSNCRLLDALEAGTTGAGSGEKSLLVLGFESPHHPVDAPMELALEIAREHGGAPALRRGDAKCQGGGASPAAADASGGRGWGLAQRLPPRALPARHLRRLRRPLRDLRDGDHLGPLRGLPRRPRWRRSRSKVAEVCDAPAEGPGAPRVSCRFTHVYPDGPAPYFTVMAPAVRGGEVEQWDEIKAAAAEARDRGRRHDHPPPRRRPRPPPLVRPPAPGTLRGGPARREGRAGPGRDAESRRADRSVGAEARSG